MSTWNDYGEEATIEPTLEYGYKYLFMLQKSTGVDYQQADLGLIHRWYQACIAQLDNARVKGAYNTFVQLKTGGAKALLDTANGKN